MTLRWVLVVILSLLITSSVRAQPAATDTAVQYPCSPETDQQQTPPPKETAPTIRIDARCWSGTLSLSVRPGATIRFVVEHKNPFLYTYRITLNEAVVEEPQITAFLGQISGLFAPSTNAVKTDAKAWANLKSAIDQTQAANVWIAKPQVAAPKDSQP